ncbi:MAG: hypothetical protein RSD62_10015, partial [Ruthenibacterium sp.]
VLVLPKRFAAQRRTVLSNVVFSTALIFMPQGYLFRPANTVETTPYGIAFALQKLTPCGVVSPFPQKGTLRSPVRLQSARTTAPCRYHLFAAIKRAAFLFGG